MSSTEVIVRKWIRTVCHDLHIRVPVLRIIDRQTMLEEANYGGFSGAVYPRHYLLTILDGIPDHSIVNTIAHECRHLWQYVNEIKASDYLANSTSIEMDANNYAHKFCLLHRSTGEASYYNGVIYKKKRIFKEISLEEAKKI